MYFSKIDEKATKQNVASLLDQQRGMKMELAHLKLSTDLSAVQYDGINGQGHANGVENSLLADITRIQKRRDQLAFRLAYISNTLVTLHDIDDFNDYLATLLEYKFNRRWSVAKCCQLLATETAYGREKFVGMVSSTQFYKHLGQALLAFVEIYPERSKLIVEKTGQKTD